MRERPTLLSLALLILAAGACGKKAEPVVLPEPAPTETTPAPPPATNPTPVDNTAEREAAMRAALMADVTAMIHFDYDQASIKPEDMAVLDRKAAILNANPALRIRISGHADDRGSDEYNLVLGNNRALAAKRYLEGKGVSGSRIEITSFGEERPLDTTGTEEGWSRNRRDEFEIIAGGERLVAPR
jgi:peptidoglycan-associated lipoprotein